MHASMIAYVFTLAFTILYPDVTARESQAVLQSQVHPDVVNFNAAISALAVAGRASQAQDLLDCMAPRRLGAGQSSIIFGH